MHRRHTGIPVPCKVELRGRGGSSAPRRHGAHRSLGEGDDDNCGLDGLANVVGHIVAEMCASAWTHGSPPVVVALLLQESILTIEVSDAGAGLAGFAGPRPLGAAGRGFPTTVERPADRNRRRALGNEGVGAAVLPVDTPRERARGRCRLSGIASRPAGSQCGNSSLRQLRSHERYGETGDVPVSARRPRRAAPPRSSDEAPFAAPKGSDQGRARHRGPGQARGQAEMTSAMSSDEGCQALRAPRTVSCSVGRRLRLRVGGSFASARAIF